MQKTPLSFLDKFISFQSVSTDPLRKDDVFKTAEFLRDFLKRYADRVYLISKKSAFPLVVAVFEPLKFSGKTLAVYGHYDVQPEDPVEQWRTPAFKLIKEDGKLWGRGVADNKGHIVQNIFSVISLVKEKKLKNRVIFLFEGEEELGSPNLESLLAEIKDDLRDVDCFFITDTGMFGKNKPQIFYALRGLCYFELDIHTGVRDLHSGVYGNKVLNPAHILVDLVSKMKDAFSNEVLIPGFYDSVRKIRDDELEMLAKVKKTIERERKETGVYGFAEARKTALYLMSKILPSLDINGVHSGFIGKGQKTIIPHYANIKFSCRLVEFQKPDEIERLVERFINDYFSGKPVRYKLKKYASAMPFYTDTKNPFLKKTVEILKDVFGNEVLLNRSGGTIPAAEIFQRLFGKPVILTGFTLPDDNIHSPNENFDEEMFWKGIDVLERIYSQLATA